ncbi:hypothetical protein NT2_02_01580 [Caenibius tardaugens NBRC 16725]|uniref:DUF1003 domain-containing protein n=1 Tax=Caenibius tardaugens NBRC 16725 TaxID=1219035 RepID=U2YIC2_9SPHN|nr:DUF1003 domain-containing protein [Caenibius tardaugens]AZI34572.1 DUF1003 domain-containing protein [Caenibius tardaugens NBRC 16725]GAD48075.1 hypothetical protein NT2_02_01580 [Caenibius tardaugens NBRC 16725]
MKLDTSPEGLAEELLGRPFDQLDAEERAVLHRVCSGEVFGLDADERAAASASFGDKLADRVAAVGGSWAFIGSFVLVLFVWMVINSHVLEQLGFHPFDAYPYIFLNLMLSMLAALQAPVIMMSQNRQAKKDRVAARHDYEVNLRTTIELLRLHRKIDRVLSRLGHLENGNHAEPGRRE